MQNIVGFLRYENCFTADLIGASAASPVLAMSMPTLFVCLYICHQPTGRIAHVQKLAKHMLCLLVALAPQMLCILLVMMYSSECGIE